MDEAIGLPRPFNLDLERLVWRYPGAKAVAIRERFGLTNTQYYQQLNALIDTEEAYKADPMLVKRLRERRVTRLKSTSL